MSKLTREMRSTFLALWQDPLDLSSITKRKNILFYIGCYTAAFLAAFVIAYSPFLAEGISFVWNSDGRTQHFPILVYIGRYLRQQAINILHGQFSFPLFDLNMGLGDDVIGFLNSLGGTDPLMLLSALVPARYSEYLYGFLAIFRIYLAGLSFSILCCYFNKKPIHTLIGSMVYCFNGYALFCSMRHPFYVTPMILLPLLIVGTDKILQKQKPYILVLTIFYSALCGYYHIYMMSIMVFVYALVRFFDLYKENRKKEFISAVGRGTVAYSLGLGIAGIIFVPSVLNFLNANRNGYSNYNPYAYTWTYFRNRFLRLIAPSGNTSWSYVACAAIILFAVALLFSEKQRRTIKILTITAFVTWGTSIGGLIMNGFQYSSNRWTFGFVLILAFVVVEMLPELLKPARKQRFICIAVLCVYMAIVFTDASARKLTYVLVGISFLALTLCVMGISLDLQHSNESLQKCAETRWRAIVCLLLVIVNVGINGLYFYASDQGNYIAAFGESGSEIERLERIVERKLEPYLLENPSGRTDSSSSARNTAMVWRIPGMLVYNSVANRYVIEFWNSIEREGSTSEFCIFSTGQRTIAGTLLSEKYHIESEKGICYVPFGYSEVKKTKDGYIIYENDYALPWGYTYETAVSYDTLTSMNGLQKQEAMLQAIALSSTEGYAKTDELQFDEYAVPYQIKYDGCKWKNNTFTVSKANGTVKLIFSMPAGVEGYVRLNKFDMNESGVRDFSISVQCDGVSKRVTASSDLYNYYYGCENFLFNLGYSEEARTELTITFPTKGTYKLDDIELYALPMDNYPERVEALRAEPLESIEWTTNRLSGTVDLSKDKILCVSVPYSIGWSATVDGKKVEILRGNYMFMAIPLTAGHHDIVFSYCPPGLKLGAILTVISIGTVVGMFVSDRKKKHLC